MNKRLPTISSVGITIAAGSAFGILVTVALTPIISRIFTPEIFGEFSTLVAVAAVFVGVSTLRFEIFAQAENNNEEFVAAMRLALVFAIVTAAALSVLTLTLVAAVDLSTIWILLGPLVLVASLQLTGAAALVHDQKYRQLSLANFWQQGTIGVWQVAIGTFAASTVALIVAFTLARTVWLVPTTLSVKSTASSLRRYFKIRGKEAATAGLSALVNSVAGQTLIILVAFLYGSTEVGLLAMAVRIVISPVGMAAQAFSSAVIGEVGKAIRLREIGTARSIVEKGMLTNLKLGIVPVALIALVSPYIAGQVLGPEWNDVGIIIALLSVGALAQFVVAPFSQVLNLTSRSGLLLKWDCTRLGAYLAVIGVPALVGSDWLVAISFYSAVQVVVYVLLFSALRSALAGAEASPRVGVSK